MTDTPKQKNGKMEKQKSVFTQIKNTAKRGRGLSKASNLNLASNNINIKEGTEAVAIKNKRNTRVSTYITEEAGDMIDKLIFKIKKRRNKKPTIAEVIELALEELYKTTE